MKHRSPHFRENSGERREELRGDALLRDLYRQTLASIDMGGDDALWLRFVREAVRQGKDPTPQIDMAIMSPRARLRGEAKLTRERIYQMLLEQFSQSASFDYLSKRDEGLDRETFGRLPRAPQVVWRSGSSRIAGWNPRCGHFVASSYGFGGGRDEDSPDGMGAVAITVGGLTLLEVTPPFGPPAIPEEVTRWPDARYADPLNPSEDDEQANTVVRGLENRLADRTENPRRVFLSEVEFLAFLLRYEIESHGTEPVLAPATALELGQFVGEIKKLMAQANEGAGDVEVAGPWEPRIHEYSRRLDLDDVRLAVKTLFDERIPPEERYPSFNGKLEAQLVNATRAFQKPRVEFFAWDARGRLHSRGFGLNSETLPWGAARSRRSERSTLWPQALVVRDGDYVTVGFARTRISRWSAPWPQFERLGSRDDYLKWARSAGDDRVRTPLDVARQFGR